MWLVEKVLSLALHCSSLIGTDEGEGEGEEEDGEGGASVDGEGGASVDGEGGASVDGEDEEGDGSSSLGGCKVAGSALCT